MNDKLNYENQRNKTCNQETGRGGAGVGEGCKCSLTIMYQKLMGKKIRGKKEVCTLNHKETFSGF